MFWIVRQILISDKDNHSKYKKQFYILITFKENIYPTQNRRNTIFHSIKISSVKGYQTQSLISVHQKHPGLTTCRSQEQSRNKVFDIHQSNEAYNFKGLTLISRGHKSRNFTATEKEAGLGGASFSSGRVQHGLNKKGINGRHKH